MNKVTAALSITAVLAIGAVVACNRKVAPPPTMISGNLPPIDIFAVDANNCDVSARVANAYRHLKHKVAWHSEDNPYTVVFRPADGSSGSGTPFVDSHGNPIYTFSVSSTNPAITPVPSTSGYFEYAINDQNNKQCKDPKDPGLIVKD